MNLLDQSLNATDLVNEYADMLYRFALQRVKNSDTAKDIVQDTFLAAWRNKDNYKGEASVKSWLFIILKNKLIDHYRKSSAKVTESISANENNDDYFFDKADHWTAEASPKTWSSTSTITVETKEFYTILHNCKQKLREVQNTVFTMKYLEGMESEEICKVLELSPSNYWILVHRAKVQLRGCLEKNWFFR